MREIVTESALYFFFLYLVKTFFDFFIAEKKFYRTKKKNAVIK